MSGVNVGMVHAQSNSSGTAGTDYSMSILSAGTTTVWQKTFKQTIVYSESTDLQKLIYDTLKNSGAITPSVLGISVYLVPVDPVSTASTSKSSYNKYLNQAYKPNLLSSVTAPGGLNSGDNFINPSPFLYTDPISSNTKWGYYVGYLPVKDGLIFKSNKDFSEVTSLTSGVWAFNFAWIPTGSYYVYLIQGVSSYTDSSGDLQSSVFSIRPPFGNFDYMEKIAKIEAGVLPSNSMDLSNPGYNRELFALPSLSATRPIKLRSLSGGSVKTDMATETDRVIGIMSTQPIKVTQSPAPAVLITSPSDLSGNNLWHRGDIHRVSWLTNFQRSHINNTGNISYADISIGKIYGYPYDFSNLVGGVASDSVAAQISGGIIAKFGSNIRSFETIYAMFSKTLSPERAKLAIVKGINNVNPSAPLDHNAYSIMNTLAVIPFVNIIADPLNEIFSAVGLYDAPMPYKVSVFLQAVPYDPRTNTYDEKHAHLMRPIDAGSVAGLNQFLESGRAAVPLVELPLGNYVVRMVAAWGLKFKVNATSSPFTVLPSGSVGSDVTGVKFYHTTSGTKVVVTGHDFTPKNNTLMVDLVNVGKLDAQRVAMANGLSSDVKITYTEQENTLATNLSGLTEGKMYQFSVANLYGTSSPLLARFKYSTTTSLLNVGRFDASKVESKVSVNVSDSKENNQASSTDNNQSNSSTSSINELKDKVQNVIKKLNQDTLPIITYYVCPDTYVLFGNQCSSVKLGDNNLPNVIRIQATPTYKCPVRSGYIPDSSNSFCVKPQ